jgi:Domain of unknown function (DUF4158)
MPRRELLTSSEREQLLALPRDDGALLRVATLSKEDLAFIGQHRGDHNRLGVGIQLCYLRHLGRVVGPDEAPDAQLLGLVAVQLRFLLGFGIFTPIAIRRGASIYKRSWNASASNNLTGSRTERSRNGCCQSRCKRRKVSCLLKLSLKNLTQVPTLESLESLIPPFAN